jgi:hypothetical protein
VKVTVRGQILERRDDKTRIVCDNERHPSFTDVVIEDPTEAQLEAVAFCEALLERVRKLGYKP